MEDLSSFLLALANLRKRIRSTSGAQIFSLKIRAELRALAKSYFSEFRSGLSKLADEAELSRLDRVFHGLNELSHRNASKAKCVGLLDEAKREVISLETKVFCAFSNGAEAQSRAETLVVSSLQSVCPSAALAYQQALLDMRATERLSWRGPATDMREALRETLDVLAPDEEVERVPGFKFEPDLKRPSMKQKTRYVLQKRGMTKNQIASPESAISGIEEVISGLTRSVYTRSSISTHTPTGRDEVARVQAWVRLVMCELLELPIA